uniref:transposase n=1 Tax=Arsenophonus nasoniae TaxID=638 RepID=UPI001FE7BCAE|nr:transposase [Arsenophonus nasoniae]
MGGVTRGRSTDVGKCTKKTKGAWHSVKYLGRYLKRPRYLRQNCGITEGAVVHHYHDHRTGQHRQQTLPQEEMIRRYISHIPARHFKMVRYSGFVES